MAEHRYTCIVQYPHRAGEIRPRIRTTSFASKALADAFVVKAEREPGVKAIIHDKGDKTTFEHKPFACLAGLRVG